MVEYVMRMGWIEIHIQTTKIYADEIGTQLTTFGAQALTLRDAGNEPIFEPSLNKPLMIWQQITLVALFDHQQEMNAILIYLKQLEIQGLLDNFKITTLEEEDWERRCLDSFKPLSFGKRLWICPSWQTPPAIHAINVILDPGLAFGTGTHPTTALCLEWLDENIQSATNLIDYGCGSGILAIAALKLGASKATAIDHDSAALKATRENADRNNVSASQLQTYLPHEFRGGSVDLVIANILAAPLIEMASYLANLVNKSGQILLSGILIEQATEVLVAYTPWFDMQPIVYKEEWVRLVGTRQ
jgi:ribosomal protein L11 methyltransferase